MATTAKRPTRAERASAELAKLLGGEEQPEGITRKLAPPKRAGKVEAKAPAKASAKAAKQGVKPKLTVVKGAPAKAGKGTMSEALKRKLKGATEAQVERVRTILGYDPEATFQAVDSDGDILARYVPRWEQGRAKNGEWVPGPARQYPYLIDRGGHVSGHGFKYRSSQAEKKLKPLEEANAKRLARTTKAA